MALQKDLTLIVFGETLVIANAYFKITNLNGSKEKMNVQLTVLKSDEKTVIKDFFFSFVPNAEPNAQEITTQAYEYIKTQPEFIDAIDC